MLELYRVYYQDLNDGNEYFTQVRAASKEEAKAFVRSPAGMREPLFAVKASMARKVEATPDNA